MYQGRISYQSKLCRSYVFLNKTYFVQVKYGTYNGLAEFRVWFPELPVNVSVADTQLGIIQDWRVPHR